MKSFLIAIAILTTTVFAATPAKKQEPDTARAAKSKAPPPPADIHNEDWYKMIARCINQKMAEYKGDPAGNTRSAAFLKCKAEHP